MAPNICIDYNKELYNIAEVVPNTSAINEKTFILRNRLYKIVEYKIVNSTSYTGSVQIFFYDFADSLEDVYAYIEDNSDFSDEQKIKGILALRLPYDFLLIARYTFTDLRISIEGNRKLGKQIKGAYIDSDHSSIGLTTYVYKYLFNTYQLLISDNEQTLDGYSLWLYGVSSWNRVLVYDIQEDEVICENLDHESNEILPWKVHPNLSKKDYILTQEHECRFYNVLFIMQ